jgi:hypothetical protein
MARYEALRLERTSRIVLGSAANATRFHNPLLADPVGGQSLRGRRVEMSSVCASATNGSSATTQPAVDVSCRRDHCDEHLSTLQHLKMKQTQPLQQLLHDLVHAFQILAMEGQGSGISGHLTARLPGARRSGASRTATGSRKRRPTH